MAFAEQHQDPFFATDDGEFIPVDFSPDDSRPTLAEELADAYRFGSVPDDALSEDAVDPLATSGAASSKGGAIAARTITLLASVAIHIAATGFFWDREPAIKVAGGEPVSVTMVGNAFETLTLSGETSPEPTQPVEPVDPVEPQDTPIEPTEQTEPVETPPEPVEQAEASEPQPTPPQPVETAETPEELQAVEPSSDPDTAVTVAPPEAETPPEPEEAETEAAEEVAPVEPVEPQAAEPAETAPIETAEAIEPEPEPVPDAPVPTPRPEYTPPPPRETVQRQPEPQPQRGNEGRQEVSQQRGSSQGQTTTGAAQQSSGSSRAQQAGNAAVSNYPGEVRSRLNRALRYPRGARGRVSGEVHVSFTVTASGGAAGISITRSSGSPILDQAAVETVQRAAPFPAIPAGAGRSSWQFTVPLAFNP